jgi:hemerythrin-like domain-containing protein
VALHRSVVMESLFARLEHEHRAILEAVNAFASFLSRAETADVDVHDLPRFVLFFREYVDLIHHDREERVLLPALVRHDFAPCGGPLGHVRDQHARERELLRALLEQCFRRGGCSPNHPELVRAAQAFISFQRTHIEQETHSLYPAARAVLLNDASRLQADLARFDAEREVYGRSAWLERLLGELSAVYAPRRSAA